MQEGLPVVAQIAILAIQLGVILFAARLCGIAAEKFKVPSVLGELIAGIIIGPYVLGQIGIPLHGFEHGLFPLTEGSSIPVSVPLYGIATLGSIILLFMSGLETDLRMFFRYSVVGTIVGLGGVIFSFVFGAGLGAVAFGWAWMDPRSLFLGILCTATSVGITARILSEKRSIDTPEGTTIMAAAVIDDVLGIICLAVVMGIVAASGSSDIAWSKIGIIAAKSFGIWLGVTAVGLLIAHKIASGLKFFKDSTVFAIMALGLALLLAGLFEQAGLAMIVGAYVMGLCLSKTDISFSIQRPLMPVYSFLVPVFFVVMGMLVDVRVLTNPKVLGIGMIYAALAVTAKVIGCALPARFMNFNSLGALRIGIGMIPRGEVALIIAGIGATTMMKINGADCPVIGKELFGVAIIMTLVTTLVAPPLLTAVLSIRKKGVIVEKEDTSTVITEYEFPSEMIRDFVLRDVVDNFRQEGFRHSNYAKGNNIINFRREAMTFTLSIEGNTFSFESNHSEIVLIRTVMYETLIELHQNFTQLKSIATPGDMSQLLSGTGESDENPLDKTIRLGRIIDEHSIVRLEAKTKEEAIVEMVSKLSSAGLLKDSECCLRDVIDREKTVTTCMPGGFALPHGRSDGASKLIAAIGISKEGIASDAQDQMPTKLFVLSLCPKDAAEPYLRFVAHIAGVLSSISNLDELLKMDDIDIRNFFIGDKK